MTQRAAAGLHQFPGENVMRAGALPWLAALGRQCGLLTFLEPTACPTQRYQINSTVSATAVAAALNPNPPVPCPLFPVRAPPTPACIANRCQAAM